MTSPTPACSFVVIVPVKPPARGKSRLEALTAGQRRDLAAAFARDTVAAARRTPHVETVLVVTDDFRFAADLRADGCEVIPDGVSNDLNATLRQAAAEAGRRWPDAVPSPLYLESTGRSAFALLCVLNLLVDVLRGLAHAFAQDRIDDAVLLRLFWAHEVVAIRVLLHLLNGLARVVGNHFVHASLDVEDLASLDLDF